MLSGLVYLVPQEVAAQGLIKIKQQCLQPDFSKELDYTLGLYFKGVAWFFF